MNLDPELSETRSAVLLAAALHLLSCSALHGVSRAKCQAMVRHLGELAERADTDPLLARTCDELADVWHRIADEVAAQQRQDAEAHNAMAERGNHAVLH